MSETTALVPTNQMTIDEIMTVGKTMAASGYFQDAKQAAQAVVKILAGREMGFGPFASMTGINIIKSKPAIGGNLMAAAVKRHAKYDYQVVTLDADICELAFFEGGKELGRSIFTKEDAVAAEVGKLVAPGASRSMMVRFARNMLFNRAMSNGVRWYCPDVFMGAPVYTPDELGAQTNAAGDIIDLTPTATRPTPATDSTPKPNGHRPYAPSAIKERLGAIANNGDQELCTQAQRQLIASKLNECFAGADNADSKRHTITAWLFGIHSTKLLTKGHVDALIKWITLDGKKDDTGDYPLHPQAPAEAAAIIKATLIDAGQTEMPLDGAE